MKQENRDDVDAINTRVIKLISLKKWDRALKEASTRIAIYPECVELRYNAAVSLIELKKYKDAKKELKIILQNNPYNHTAFYLMAIIAMNSSFRWVAVKWIKKAIEIDNNIACYHAIYASLIADQKEALLEIKKALEIDPEDKTANEIYSFILYQHNNKDDAENQTKKLLSDDPDNATAWYLSAMNYIQRGDLKNAQEAVSTALQINPEIPDAQILYLKLAATKHPYLSLYWRIAFFIKKYPALDEYQSFPLNIFFSFWLIMIVLTLTKLYVLAAIIICIYIIGFVYSVTSMLLFSLIKKGLIKDNSL